jgi:hypothetical protein
MISKYNEETKQVEWIISRWYDKVLYVCGWLFAIAFLIGFVDGLMGK